MTLKILTTTTEVFSELKGSWLWAVKIEPLHGEVVVSGTRSGNEAVRISLKPVEALGMGMFAEFGLVQVFGLLAGGRVKAGFKKALDIVRRKS